MMLKITLWGTPDDVADAAMRVQKMFSVLHESENEPDETGIWVKRHLKVTLEVENDVFQEGEDIQPILEMSVQRHIPPWITY
jgi:hypothetical protein